MHWHTVDYRERAGRRGRKLVDRGFWLSDVPRLILLCRLLGHRPVVDGTDPIPTTNPRYQGPGNRWVCCDRCGIRPDPQGSLDPDEWDIGDPYTGPFRLEWPTDRDARFAEIKAGGPPGPWPAKPTGTIGGQLVIGKTFSTSLEVKIGNPGSEHVLAGNVSIAPLGALFLHTEGHGRGVQRRLNPEKYHSRVIGFSAHGGRLYWQLWAKRDESSRDDPWWQHGSFRTNLLDLVLGPKKYAYTDVGDPVTATLHLPHGDQHEITLKLQRQTLARARRRRPVEESWTVDIRTWLGIPTKTGGHGRVLGFAVSISDTERDTDWVAAGLAHAAVRMTKDRARYGYRRPEPASATPTTEDAR